MPAKGLVGSAAATQLRADTLACPRMQPVGRLNVSEARPEQAESRGKVETTTRLLCGSQRWITSLFLARTHLLRVWPTMTPLAALLEHDGPVKVRVSRKL